MKFLAGLLAIVGFIVLVVGCGGGGGGGASTGTGTGTGSLSGYQISAFLTSADMIDSRNVLAGEQIQMDMTARDEKENLHVIPASGWTTNAPSTVATLTSNGVLRAVGASTTQYTVSIAYGGTPYSVPLVVSSPQDVILGTVWDGSNGIENAAVDFFDAGGSQVGVAYTSRNGSFQGSVPSTATTFTLNMSVPDPGNVYYYPQFAYNTLEYLEQTTCLAPLPTPLSPTGVNSLPSKILPNLRTSGPPPPPTGCLG